ncbi:MAG: winged helix-turn-helix domain-containing protein [Candidatus Nealsonbacteria bacterium]|nr:winged helix-turn-helix domain-containing protein [Candidatus Nealsonbacteria bacterium]
MLSKTEAAYKILKDYKKPLHVKDIIEIAIKKGLIITKGKTPEATLRVDMSLENKRRKKQKKEIRFYPLGEGVWGLTKWKK